MPLFNIQLSYSSLIGYNQLIIFTLVFTLSIVISTIVLSLLTGQGGSRIKVTDKTEIQNEINQDEDHYWKLGQIYYNPDDSALFVEKRFGIGWTVNFARPPAWMILLTILLLAVGLPILFSI